MKKKKKRQILLTLFLKNEEEKEENILLTLFPKNEEEKENSCLLSPTCPIFHIVGLFLPLWWQYPFQDA